MLARRYHVHVPCVFRAMRRMRPESRKIDSFRDLEARARVSVVVHHDATGTPSELDRLGANVQGFASLDARDRQHIRELIRARKGSSGACGKARQIRSNMSV